MPTLDASQDYTLLNASEAGGYTQLIFERPRDTGDENDFAFMVSEGQQFRGKDLEFTFCSLSRFVQLNFQKRREMCRLV